MNDLKTFVSLKFKCQSGGRTSSSSTLTSFINYVHYYLSGFGIDIIHPAAVPPTETDSCQPLKLLSPATTVNDTRQLPFSFNKFIWPIKSKLSKLGSSNKVHFVKLIIIS